MEALKRAFPEVFISNLSGSKMFITKSIEELADAITIHDIAVGLSNMNRYSGQTLRPYSVAEHCLYVASLYPDNHRLQLMCLLHDASEAFIADIPAPIKPMIPNYGKIEAHLMDAVYYAFGVTKEERELYQPLVDRADRLVLYAELVTFNKEVAREVFIADWDQPYLDTPSLHKVPYLISPYVARGAFLKVFNILQSGKTWTTPVTCASDLVKMQLR